jgi:RNA polymerase sigma-70 factor (ECF subfamily)
LAEEAARVTDVMEQLGTKQKKVLNLAVCEGWSHQQIADRLGWPLGTVKTNIRRGLIRVRELLEAEANVVQKEAGL